MTSALLSQLNNNNNKKKLHYKHYFSTKKLNVTGKCYGSTPEIPVILLSGPA